MKKLSLLIFLLICAITCTQAQTFKSARSGSWSDPGTWLLKNGNTWVVASGYPGSTPADSILIEPSHEVRAGSVVHAPNLFIKGKLVLDSAAGISSGFRQIIIENGGNLVNAGNFAGDSIRVQFLQGSFYTHQFRNQEGVIPMARWSEGSTVMITGYRNFLSATSSGNWSQPFSNLIWATPELTGDFFLNGLLKNIRGTLTINNTNNQVLRFTNDQSTTITIQNNFEVTESARFSVSRTGPNSSHVILNIGGDFNFRSSAAFGSRICEQGTSAVVVSGNFYMDRGTLYFSSGSGGTSSAGADLKVAGNVLFTSGTIDASIANSNRVGDLFFIGTNEQKIISTGNIVGVFNYRLNPGSKVLVPAGQQLIGSSFECNACTFITESTDPAGAIQKSATGGGSIRVRTQFWNPGSTVIYRGTARQFISSDHPQQAGITTVIDNPAGVETSANGSGITVGSNLDILRGGVHIARNNLTVRGNLNTYGGPVSLSSVGLTSARTLTVDGELLLTGSGERLKIESSPTTNAANAVLVLNGNIGGTGSIGFTGPNSQLTIGGVTRTFRRILPVTAPFSLEQLSMNVPSTTLTIDQPLTLGNYTASTNSWTGGLIIQAGTVRMNASLIIRTVAGLLGGVLDFSGQELELRRNIQTNWPAGGFAGDRNAVMKVTSSFSGVDNVIAFVPGKDTLGTLILDRSANVQAVGGLPITPHIKINSPLTISKLLELRDGELYHQSGLSLASGATFIRTPDAGFSVTTIFLPSGGPYRLIYKDGLVPASISAGLESQGVLKTLKSEITQELTLRSAVSIRDSLSIYSGQFTLSSDTLALGRVELSGLLEVRPGATLNAGNDQLTLLNRSVKVAGRIGVLETGANVNGNIRVEQFMPAKGWGFHHISASLAGVRFNQLTDDLYFYPNNLYQYLEGWLGYKDIGWSRNLSPDSVMKPGRGYLILPRWGSENMNNIWDVTGPIVRGSVNMPVSWTPSNPVSYADDGWNLLGNPYASPILWSLDPTKWSDGSGGPMKNMDPFVSVRDLSGVIRSWDASTGIGDLSEGTGIIPTGTAFWVHANGSAPKLVLHEQAKSPVGGIFYRKANEVLAGIKLSISKRDQSASCFLLNRIGTSAKYDSGKDALLKMDTVLAVGLISTDRIPLVQYAAESMPEEIKLFFTKGDGSAVNIKAESLHLSGFPVWIRDVRTGIVRELEEGSSLAIFSENDRYIVSTMQPDFSETVIPTSEKRVFVAPNPIVGNQLRLMAAAHEVQKIQVMDLTGQIKGVWVNFEEDEEGISVPIELAPGLYVAVIQTSGGIIRERFRVQN